MTTPTTRRRNGLHSIIILLFSRLSFLHRLQSPSGLVTILRDIKCIYVQKKHDGIVDCDNVTALHFDICGNGNGESGNHVFSFKH